jgi:hypothetical protein
MSQKSRKTDPTPAERAAGTNLGGRPPIEGPQVSHIEAIKTMAGYGLTQQQMATILGWSHDTFTRRKKDDPDVGRALEEGRATAAYNVADALYNKAVGYRGRAPETAAIRWYEISRLGMKDRVVVEGDAENPIIAEVRELSTSQKIREMEEMLGGYQGEKNGNGNGNGRRRRRTGTRA